MNRIEAFKLVKNKSLHTMKSDDVYIGRPSKWGNPFSSKPSEIAQYRVASKDEALEKYEQYIRSNPELMEAAKKELKGKRLFCWCAPKRCHGHILSIIANLE